MGAKEWLERGWKLNDEIDALLEARCKAAELALRATASWAEKVQTSPGNASEEHNINLAYLSRKIDEKIDELYLVKTEILTAVGMVENSAYRTLLIERYINFKTWEEIAERMGRSAYWTRTRLHDDALAEIEKGGNFISPPRPNTD